MGGFCGYGGSVWVMGEWAVGYWIVGVTSFQKMYGYMGLRSIGRDQLDRFRTWRYNHNKKLRILPLLGRYPLGPTKKNLIRKHNTAAVAALV